MLSMILGIISGSLLFFGFSEKKLITAIMGVVTFLIAMSL